MDLLRNMIQRRILPRQVPVIFKRSSLAGYQKVISDTAPLAYWPLDEGSGTVVYDRSGHGYHGVYSGATLANATAPGGGMAPLFDGANDKAEMQPADLLAALNHSEFTMMAWARVLNAAVWDELISREVFHIRVDNSNRAYMLKSNTVNRFQFIYNGNSGTTKLHEWLSMTQTGWMHLVHTISVSGNAINTYIDNVKFSPTATGITAYLGTPTVGVGSTGTGAWWKGWLAHAAIWNRALSDAEVAALYNGGL